MSGFLGRVYNLVTDMEVKAVVEEHFDDLEASLDGLFPEEEEESDYDVMEEIKEVFDALEDWMQAIEKRVGLS